jgi:hypothetical protein
VSVIVVSVTGGEPIAQDWQNWGPLWVALQVSLDHCTADVVGPSRPINRIGAHYSDEQFVPAPAKLRDRLTTPEIRLSSFVRNIDPSELQTTRRFEGGGGGAFQTLMLIGIDDPWVLADVEGFVSRMAKGMAT